MKKRVSLLLVIAMLLSMIPFVASAAEPITLISVTNEEVTTAGYTYEYTAETAGTLTVIPGACTPGYRYKVYGPGYESLNMTQYSTSHDHKVAAGACKIVFNAYGGSTTGVVAGTVSFDVIFTPDEGSGEVEKAEYEVSETALVLGDNSVTLLDTAVTTIYVFEPTETAVYTFTAPEGATLGYWGAGSWFLSNPNSTTNTYEWTCTGVGQTAYIGVSGVDGEFNLNVAKTGDYTVVETQIVKYENKATLTAWEKPEGATWTGYVDIYGETHTAVLGDDGYYHLDSADGDVLVVDLDYMDIILSAALQSDRPIMYAYMYDENGNIQYKYDIGDAIKEYEAVMDANGNYPVTEDIILFYQVYAMQAGTFTFHVTGDYNEECVWMYCMRTMNMDNVTVDPEEPEETEPTEPSEEPSVPESSEPEPSEPETEPSVPTEPSEPETEPTEPSVPSVPEENVPAGTKYALVSGSNVTYYSSATAGTINSVIKAAPVGAMIILYDDIDLGSGLTCFEVYKGSEIILDLNGHTMTYSYASIGAAYIDGGKLTVQDSSAEGTGMITNTNKNGIAIEVYSGTLIFEGGNASSKIGAKVWANASMTMAGGSISGSQYAINALADSAVTVSGGELVQTAAGSLNYSLYAASTATMSVTGGYFNGNVSGSGLNGKISGGYYTAAVSTAYIAAGYERQANDDSVYKYKVVDPNATEEPDVPTQPTEPVKDAYAVSTTELAVGSNTVSMVETAEATIFKFNPTEAGTYTITGPEGSKVGIWGYSSNLKDPNSTSNSCELSLTNVGPTVRVGVTGAEGQIVVTVTKNEEPTEPSEPDPEPSEPDPEPSEPADSMSATNLPVTAAGQTVTINAQTTGTLNVTMGTCNPGWQYRVYGPNGFDSGNRGSFSAGITCDYDITVAGEWRVVFYAYTSADGRTDGTVSYTVTFTPDETTEPSEPDPEPSEPTEPSEPETEPTEPSEPSEPGQTGTVISVTDETVTTAGCSYEFTAATDGTLTVIPGACTPGYRYKVYGPGYESLNMTQYSTSHDHKITAGTWTIKFYAYGGSTTGVVDGKVSFDVVFTPDQGGEVVKEEYQISETQLVLGDNSVTLLDTAITTIYVFEPTETGVYTFTAPAGAILGYWGAGDWFLSNPNSTTNTYEWTCTGVGQTAYIGVSGVDGEFNLNVAKTGDYTVVETQIVKYENQATLESFTLPEGATLGSYVDVFGATHTAVLGEDGYYHLDSVDGPILLIDMDYMDIILSAALKSDRPIMYAYMYDEDGNIAYKYDIGDAVLAYEAVMDANGYYPVTEDILLFYQVYAVQAGTYTFHLSGSYNEECVWMYCMRTMTLPEPEPEPVYVAAVYADGVQIAQYTTVTEAIANCGEGQYVVLLDNVTEQITVNSNVYLDLNGFNADSITVADGCTLFLFDSATDDYQGAYGTAVVTGTVESLVTANGKSYLVVCEDGKYSAHCYALELTHISLDAANDALGYKAELKGDSIVQNAVTAYGFTMGVQVEKTYELTENFDGTFTLRLKGIMAAGGGEMNITATAFVKFGENTVQTAQEETTMKETLQAVNSVWSTYSQAQQDTVVALCKQYESVTSQWELENIFDVINGVIDIPVTGNPDGNP